jgi:hypothetical protein
LGTLFGQTQNQTSAEAANQESNLSLQALQAQANQNNLMTQEQTDMNNLVSARTSALTSDLGPVSATPYALNGLPTITTSELGDQSNPQTSRNGLLGQ